MKFFSDTLQFVAGLLNPLNSVIRPFFAFICLICYICLIWFIWFICLYL